MQVILVATDEEIKLRPLKDTIPTPLFPIVNRPVMECMMEIVARSGFNNVLVSLCNRSSAIISYFGNGSRWNMHIEYIIQHTELGSAGTLRWAAPRLQETVLVLPADIVLDLDIEKALVYHRAQQASITVILHQPIDGPQASVRVDTHGRVLGIGTASYNDQVLYHTGAYILEPHVLDHIPPHTHYQTYHHMIPALLAAGVSVYGYETQAYWNPLDSFDTYQEAQRVFLLSAYHNNTAAPERISLRVRYPSISGQQIAPGIWVGNNHSIHPEARLAAPVYIAEGCRIGKHVDLGPEAVIGTNVIIDDGATIEQSTVLSQTYIGQFVNVTARIVDRTMIIDAHTSESTQIVDPFLLSEVKLKRHRPIFKRFVTLMLALLLLLLILPLLILTGLAVFLTTRGQVITRQQRVGVKLRPIDGTEQPALETFDLLLFQTRHADGTVTRLGQWLSRSEWNHMAALWNVLKGDLDLVGVKPLLPEEATQLHEAWHTKRLDCPAGLTGLWFIQTDHHSDLDEVLVADVYYAATHNWRSDLCLLWQTPAAWLRRMRQYDTRDVHKLKTTPDVLYK